MRKAIVTVLVLALVVLLGQAAMAQDLNLTAGVDYFWGQGASVDGNGEVKLTGECHVPVLTASADLSKSLGIEFVYSSGNWQRLNDGAQVIPPQQGRFVVTLMELGGTYKLSKPGAKIASSIGAGYMKYSFDLKGSVPGYTSEVVQGFYVGGKLVTAISKDLSGKLIAKYSPSARNGQDDLFTMLSLVLGGDYRVNERANLEFGYRKATSKNAETNEGKSFGGFYVGGVYRF